MNTENRKQQKKEERRAVIIDAAETVIFSKGLENATMTEIAEEAELSKGTLYLYFKDKRELYLAIAERGSEKMNDTFAAVFTEHEQGIGIIRMMGEAYLGFVEENPGYYDSFMYYESLNYDDDIKESEYAQTCEQNTRKAINMIVKALKIGMQDGTIESSYDPGELAGIIWASTRGIIMVNHLKGVGNHFGILDELSINNESMIENFIKLIGNGISANE